jgi:hypothetical protein
MLDETLELPTNVYARALAIERRIRLAALFPDGTVPFLKRMEHLGMIAGPNTGTDRLEAPPLTVTPLIRDIDTTHFDDTKFEYAPKHTMRLLGKLDGYSYNYSVPKFDPWFRDILKAKAPEVTRTLEETYCRDPCTPERVLNHFARYDRTWKSKPTGPMARQADRIVRQLFAPIGKVEPIDFNYQGWIDILPHLDMTSSPGLPLRRKYATQGECLGFIYDKTKRLNHYAKFLPPYAVRAPPCMIGVRPGLLRKDDLDSKIKARGVWAYPAEVKVMEMRFIIPLIERISQVFGKIPYTTGRNMTKALPFIIDHLLNDNRCGFVTDISKLDTCIGPDFINWAFSQMKEWFVMGMTKSSETRNDNVWSFLQYYNCRTPVLLPSGLLYRKYGGEPSGSGFTQIIDTLVTVWWTVYSLLRMGKTEEDIIGRLFAVGDDVALSVEEDFDIEKFIRYMADLGAIINRDKVMFSKVGIELKFLGYSKYGGGIYRPIEELLQTALFPEKFVGNQDRTRQRILGQTVMSGLSNGFFAKLNYWLWEAAGYRSFDPGETFFPQRRWSKAVLGLVDVPFTFDLMELFPLV